MLRLHIKKYYSHGIYYVCNFIILSQVLTRYKNSDIGSKRISSRDILLLPAEFDETGLGRSLKGRNKFWNRVTYIKWASRQLLFIRFVLRISRSILTFQYTVYIYIYIDEWTRIVYRIKAEIMLWDFTEHLKNIIQYKEFLWKFLKRTFKNFLNTFFLVITVTFSHNFMKFKKIEVYITLW